MSPIQRVLRRAAIRLSIQRLLASLVFTLTLAGIAVLALRVLERGGVVSPDWQTAAIIGASIAFVAALAWALFRLPGREGTARIVDEAAGLKESLSTALAVESRTDAWSQAAVADAVRKARGLSVARTFPWSAPRRWPAPFVAIALFLLAGLLPSFDLLGEAEAREENRQAAQQIEAAKAEVKEIESRVSETLKELGVEDALDEFEANAELKKPEKPEDVRRRAVAKLTSVQDRLSEMREKQQGESMDALRDRLRDLKQGDTGPLDEFTKAMQKGDFEGAQDALQNLKQKLQDGSLSKDQKDQLAKQLESLGEQLSKLAQDRADLEKKLAEAGLDPNLASADPEALKQALQKAQNLTEAQKQAIQKMANSCNSACSQCNAMASMCASMGKSGESLSAAEMAAMDAKLGELAGAQSSLAKMDEAMAEFKKQMESLCQGMGQCEGDGYDPFSRPMPGSEGRGGGTPYEQKADFASKNEKSNLRSQDGPIIGSTFIEGGQIRGEAQQSFSDAVRASELIANEAIEENTIPKQYHEAIKNYFGRLDKATANATQSESNQE
ncbi:MAG: hypothetical protein RLN60_05460 [Phycisphaerales bacterium]